MPINHKAPRQRSFFDQDTKVRPSWTKAQNFSNAAHQLPEYPGLTPDMAPIAASVESKSRLAAFKFEQCANKSSDDAQYQGAIEEKENVSTVHDEDRTSLSQPDTNLQNLSQKSASRDIRECPQTPLGRLPLSELIASTEDINGLGLNTTPIERVLWNHSQQAEGSSNFQEAKTKTRHGSSSPVSSSPMKTSVHFDPGKPSIELQALQKALKTPKVDPAADLWSRYSLTADPSTDRLSPIGPTGASCALQCSSPETPAERFQTKESGGLRRSISCGIEWPTSASKRRKTKDSNHDRESNLGFTVPYPRRNENGQSKIARVNLLVEEIQKRLSEPLGSLNEEVGGPSSSSPLPENVQVLTNSAMPPKGRFLVGGSHLLPETHNQTAAIPSEVQSPPLRNVLNSRTEESKTMKDPLFSDFDDDDLDLAIINKIDEGPKVDPSIQALPAEPPRLISYDHGLSSSQPERDINGPGLRREGRDDSSVQPVDSGRGQESAPAAVLNLSGLPGSRPCVAVSGSNWNELDEFEEVDNDLFVADLEDIAARYDVQPQNHAEQAFNLDRHLKSPCNSQLSESKSSSAIAQVNYIKDIARDEVPSDDEFGGDVDFEEIVAVCEEASQKPQLASQLRSPYGQKASTIQRYLIVTVAEGTYEKRNGMRLSEKVLLVQNEKTKVEKAITLRGYWFESPCMPGSYVHLVGDFNQHGQCIVDDFRNLIIIHPDHLISATVVADSFSCTRRAVLQDRVKATSQNSEPTVYGSMLHEIFQEAMKANRWDTEWMTLIIEKIATSYLESLFELNIELRRAVDHLKSKAVGIQAWAEVFVTSKPKGTAIVKDRNGGQALMSVNKLLDVEEKIWSPVYGLKGMVDATVQVLMRDGKEERTLTVPLEVKTGKFPNAAHKAQTALYTLLLSDRYDVEVIYGILYYTETSEISRIPAIRHELIHMLMQRNELACYVRQRLELPPLLKSPHLCGKCYAQSPCFLYHKLIDDGNGESSGMRETFNNVTKHLKPDHQKFFQKWDDLITKEEKVVMKLRRELWTMQSEEREKVGRCFSNVIIDPEFQYEQPDGPKMSRFMYAFKKQNLAATFSFAESQITAGEPIVISDEKGHFALASGFVARVQKHSIHLTVDRRLHNARVRQTDFDADRNQAFTGIMEVVEDGVGRSTFIPADPQESVLYRIDKDEFSNGMATVRNNLIQLMDRDAFGAQALRRLIVEGVAPTFTPTSTQHIHANSASQASLNVDQERAIEKVMTAKDYALVLGMPGTGKTTTIAHIIRALAAQGKSVLLTSYTHTAVDNILLKIRDAGIGVFRLGNVTKIHPDVQEFADLAGVPMKTVQEIESAYNRQVVATTCLGINHPIFNQRVFDYCIVDEASQITLPVCLGPIRMAKKFILVGDHYQLPPLVQNKEALEGGLDISLFKMLSENHASSVVNLEHQYRMCEEIMALSNTLVYSGRLKCGTQAVAKRTITIPNIGALEKHHHDSLNHLPASSNICLNPARGSCWLRDLIDPSVKACLVNTDTLLPASRESQSGSRIVNHCEATLCTHLVKSLISTGVNPSDIGVIALYRSQLALIKQNLRHHQPAVEMHTADKFQGRDKEVVVLSLVRSNEQQNVGDLLKDWRRVNVAFTRARTKLLVVGSAGTLKGNELLCKFVALMRGSGWMYDLPKNALEGHIWDEMGTQPIFTSGGKGASVAVGKDTGAEVMKEKAGKAVKIKVLGDRTGNKNASRQKKVSSKVGKPNAKALIERRPVLRDIINDAS
ncbi:Tripartite DNA replication factor [Pseudocyphellaria aurata]|nr:Tripartite DNA replication factor [Pseudocyphellaria aurata]